MNDTQFNEFMNQVSTILYYTCLVIIVTGGMVLAIVYKQYKKSKKEFELFESGLRERFLRKYGHHYYFRNLDQLEKDAERMRNLKEETPFND